MHHVPLDPRLRVEPGCQVSGNIAADTRLRGSSYLRGVRIPAPQFPSMGLADRRPRSPAADQPSPAPEPPRLGQLRWGRCPEHGLLHLVQPADVARAEARGHTLTVCGHRIAAECLTISSVPAGALCMSCVMAATSGRPG